MKTLDSYSTWRQQSAMLCYIVFVARDIVTKADGEGTRILSTKWVLWVHGSC